MQLSIVYKNDISYISFKKEDYDIDTFTHILDSTVYYLTSYTPKDITGILNSIEELISNSEVIGIIVEVYNDMNINVLGVTNIEGITTV